MNNIETQQKGISNFSKEALKVDLKKIRGTARGFAIFGGFFVIFECCMEKLRRRTDSENVFVGGGGTAMLLAMDTGVRWRGLMFTGFVGGMFGVVMEKAFEGVF